MTVLPQEGQIVQVRGEHWAVSEIKAQGLPRSSADETVAGTQHALTLSSLAEDRLGEELRVVWELEPGAVALPPRDLPVVDPDRFDDPDTLAAFVDALRWGALTAADTRTLQAPFRSGATVEAYQLEPIRRALQTSRANLLLADDVGLGKTIEAGLVVQELLLRHRARTVAVVCPAGLVLKWQDEMRDKFGLEFQIVNSETIRDVRRSHGVHANPFTLFPRVIVSMSWLPGQRAQRLLNEVYAHVDADSGVRRTAFDILVVDEAHHVAPATPQTGKSGRRGYAVDTQRTRAVRDLAHRCEHRLFLTATPHNGYTESFTALLEMVDDRRFARGAQLDRKTLDEVIVRRLKKHLAAEKGFKERRVMPLAFNPTDDEEQAYERLDGFIRRRHEAVHTESGGKARDLTTLLLKKRFFSSPVAFARTVDQYLLTRGGLDDDLPEYDDVLGDNASDLEEGLVDHPESEALRTAGRTLPALTDEDTDDLEWLSRWGQSYEGRADSRLNALLAYLEEVVRPDLIHTTSERVVVFTEYVDTLDWIREVLESRGLGDPLTAVIVGGTDPEDRELIRARFQAPPEDEPVRILLATDAAGEGIDLQDHCHRLVNFDIPFNPNRLEQRIGRIDRYGQRFSPEVRHFVPADRTQDGYAGDTDFLSRIAIKIAQVEIDLGPANQVIAGDIQERLAGRKPEPVSKRTSQDDALVTEVLHGERQVRSELTRLEEQLDESRDRLHLRASNLERVVATALALDFQPPLKVVADDRTDTSLFEIPHLARHWEPVTRGLATRLVPDRMRPITFVEEAALGRTDLVYIHLGHPLLQRSTRLLRSALWGDREGVNRVSAVMVDGLDEPFVAAVTRLVLVGRGGIRLHEEVFLAGTRLESARALGEERSEDLLERALDGKRLSAVDQATRNELARLWQSEDGPRGLRSRVEDAVARRVEKRRAEVAEALKRRERDDLARVEAVFARFEGTLHATLETAQREQFEAEQMLFDDEKQQRDADLRRIRERLKTIEAERDREKSAVRRRYQDVTPHPFAAALVFALPARKVIA